MEPIELITTCSRCKKESSLRFADWPVLSGFVSEKSYDTAFREASVNLCVDCKDALEALKERFKKEREEKLDEFLAGGPAE